MPFGNDAAGHWSSVDMSQDTTTSLFSFSATLTTNSFDGYAQDPNALWLSVTNGPTPDTATGNYAGIFLANDAGRTLIVSPDTSAPGNSQTPINPVIYTGSYNFSSVGNSRTFAFTIDTDIINTWSGAGPGWLGFGFPLDATGANHPNPPSDYNMGAWLRSFGQNNTGADFVDYDAGTGNWTTHWSTNGSGAGYGTLDIGNTPVAVPEPTSFVLLGSVGLLGVGARRRRLMSV